MTLPNLPAAACAPRPNIELGTQASGPDALQVMVSANTSDALPINALSEIHFLAGSDTLVDIPGRAPGARGDFTVQLPLGTQQTVFTVRRAQTGKPAMVSLVITDLCGPWNTFVGMGTDSGTQSQASPAAAPSAAAAAPTPSPTAVHAGSSVAEPGTANAGALVAPGQADAEPQGNVNVVSWDTPPGTARTHIFRADYRPNPALGSSVPSYLEPLPPHTGVSIEEQPGRLRASARCLVPG